MAGIALKDRVDLISIMVPSEAMKTHDETRGDETSTHAGMKYDKMQSTVYMTPDIDSIYKFPNTSCTVQISLRTRYLRRKQKAIWLLIATILENYVYIRFHADTSFMPPPNVTFDTGMIKRHGILRSSQMKVSYRPDNM